MNQIMEGVQYPFEFFSEKAFTRREVLDYTAQLYDDVHKGMRKAVHAIGGMSSTGLPLYELGIVGKVCKADESFGGWEDSIRYIYAENDQDLFKTRDIYFGKGVFFGIDQEEHDAFKRDIAKALDLQHVFFINSEVEEMEWYYNSGFNAWKEVHPHSEEGIQKYFKNVPVGRVW